MEDDNVIMQMRSQKILQHEASELLDNLKTYVKFVGKNEVYFYFNKPTREFEEKVGTKVCELMNLLRSNPDFYVDRSYEIKKTVDLNNKPTYHAISKNPKMKFDQ